MEITKKQKAKRRYRHVYYVILAMLITYFQIWTIFLLFWVLPLITVVPMIVRWGAICEHLYIPNAKVEECSPIIILSWWEKLILPNLNFLLQKEKHPATQTPTFANKNIIGS